MTTPTRSRNAALNFVTSLGFTLVTLLGAMVSSRLIVHWVGKGRFGIYRTLAEWFGYLALLELGLGGAVGPLLSRSLSTGDRPAIRATLAAAIRAYFGVMAAAVTVGLVLVFALPWIIPVPPSLRIWQTLMATVNKLLGGIIPVPMSIRPDLRLGGLIALVGFATLPMIPLRSLVEADQRGYEINLLLIGQFVLITAIALMLCGFFPQWGIAGQAAAASIGALILNAALFRATLSKLPGTPLEIARTRPDATIWRGIWRLSWPTLILQFSGRINLQTDSIVLSQVVDANAVAVLYFSSRLAQMAQQQLANVGTASWAGLADLHHRGEHETFRRRLLELFKLVTILGIGCVGPIVAYNRHFVALWVGPELDGGWLLALAAGTNALLVPLVSLSGWCMSGTGRVRMLAGPSVLSATINLTSSVLLARYVGVAGPLLGTTFTMLSFGLWFNAWLLRRVFGVRARSLLASVGIPLAWGLPYSAAWWWLAASQRQLGWLGLGAQMAAAAAGFLLLAMAVLLTPEERSTWKARGRAFLGRLPRLRPNRPAEVAPSPNQSGK